MSVNIDKNNSQSEFNDKKERIISQLNSIHNKENGAIISDAIDYILSLDEARKIVLDAYQDCGSELRDMAMELDELKTNMRKIIQKNGWIEIK